jgi:ribose/xylose/arabinose/galactoside ABC-type transport system permease subunit
MINGNSNHRPPAEKDPGTQDWIPIITLVVLMIVMAIGSPRFLLPSNLHGLATQSATLLVLGLGETFIILLGSIDLSIAPVARPRHGIPLSCLCQMWYVPQRHVR